MASGQHSGIGRRSVPTLQMKSSKWPSLTQSPIRLKPPIGAEIYSRSAAVSHRHGQISANPPHPSRHRLSAQQAAFLYPPPAKAGSHTGELSMSDLNNRGAMSVNEFAIWAASGRTTAWKEIKEGRLRPVKV